ncbi:hypothetical protein [Corallococcus exercitus]|uniref:hypothetical protein n=1 Tax=Corallococcus exercitus TaxID=2316736 RepID=UPI0035D4A2C9
MNAYRFLAGLLLSLTLFAGAKASAQSCTTLVNSQFSWVQSSNNQWISVTGVSLKPRTGTVGPVASYFTGTLLNYVAPGWIYNPVTGVFTQTPARLTSSANSGRQSFNDRSYVSTYASPSRWQNFSAFATDNIQLELDATGKMTVILNSWSNTRVSVTSPTCSGNVLTGFAGGSVYSFTFEQLDLI